MWLLAKRKEKNHKVAPGSFRIKQTFWVDAKINVGPVTTDYSPPTMVHAFAGIGSVLFSCPHISGRHDCINECPQRCRHESHNYLQESFSVQCYFLHFAYIYGK